MTMHLMSGTMASDLAAFRAADFDWVRNLQSVWHDPPFDVEALHRPVADEIMDHLARRAGPGAHSPIGRLVVGPAGAGKTHLIGTLRRRVWDAKGWFILLDIVGITDFWQTAALGFITSLQQVMPDGRPQFEAVLLGVLRALPREAGKAAAQEIEQSQASQSADTADRFVALLRAAYRPQALDHQDVVRAFVLLRDDETVSSAYSWLQGLDIGAEESRRLRLPVQPPQPVRLVKAASWLLSLAGPTIIAVDQIDAIVTAANLSAGAAVEAGDDNELKARSIIEALAGGLMDLRDKTSRALTVVTCLQPTWNVLASRALNPALHRFDSPTVLEAVHDGEILAGLVEERLRAAYTAEGFSPPYPTWPFRPEAIQSAKGLPPRQILIRCEDHRRRCVAEGAVVECTSLAETGPVDPVPPPNGFDAALQERRAAVRLDAFRNAATGGKARRDLVAEALRLYVRQTETPEDVDLALRGDPDEKRPTLHGRLSFTFRNEGDREQHYCFRVIDQSNAIAFQARLRAAMTASGIDTKLTFRHLFIVRDAAPPGGVRTGQLVAEFERAGGKFVPLVDEDLRALEALGEMARENAEGFDRWLRDRKPLFEVDLFRQAGLVPPPVSATIGAKPAQDGASPEVLLPSASSRGEPADTPPAPPMPDPPADGGKPAPAPQAAPRRIPVGRRLEGGGEGRLEFLPAELLPRHTAILAGSGSGKTVLLRRIVEEAALLGIPAIVLDTNNDLARLGDPWPARPREFTDDDAAKAASYRERVEVTVWTPGLSSGRPLSLSILPDFSGLDGEDELGQAVAMARSTLVPFIGASGASGSLKEGVLSEALDSFARRGQGGLEELIAFLSDLPDGVSEIGKADKLAADIADQLRAAIATNPLLKARGQSLDPETLFQGAAGRTRISVVNFSALPAEDARQAFVNQLQMALFGWIKKRPSPTGRLYVLDEAQNFAPSGRMTPSKESAMALAAQARKYGLGMIFATQAPKGIDNKIVSNCTTHFYGRMSAPATIQAARELMAAKGGGGDDIGRLGAGQFYFATEGSTRPVKIRTPLCLTHHPANPLDAQEVAVRARA